MSLVNLEKSKKQLNKNIWKLLSVFDKKNYKKESWLKVLSEIIKIFENNFEKDYTKREIIFFT